MTTQTLSAPAATDGHASLQRARPAGHPAPAPAPLPAAPPSERLAWASGVAAGACTLGLTALFLGYFLPRMPPFGAPPAAIAAAYAAFGRDLVYRLASYLIQAQLPLFLVFFAGLRGALRRAEGPGGVLAPAVFGAGVALAVASPLVAMVEDHLLLGTAGAGVDPRVVVAFDGLVPRAFALDGFAQALVIGGTAAVLGRGDGARRVLPRWLAAAGWVVAALSLVGTGMLLDARLLAVSHPAMLLSRLWLLALALVLLRRTGRVA